MKFDSTYRLIIFTAFFALVGIAGGIYAVFNGGEPVFLDLGVVSLGIGFIFLCLVQWRTHIEIRSLRSDLQKQFNKVERLLKARTRR
jgi:hypothetical protein